MKKLVSVLLSFILLLSLLPISRVSASSLQDEMQKMAARGIITGYANGDLAPNEQVSRGQFATFLTRALKLPKGEHRFADVAKNSKLAAGINAAAKAGLISGYTPTAFGPENAITREQMAVMIDRALSYLHIDRKAGKLAFIDQADIKAKAAVSNMAGHQIILGSQTANGLAFNPQQPATRAHAAAFLSRMLDVYEEEGAIGKVEEETPKPDTSIVVPAKPAEPPAAAKYDFAIGTLDKQGTVASSAKTYKTFSDAAKAYNGLGNQVILHKNKIIKMDSGIVVAKAATKGAATYIYQSNLKILLSGIMYGSEMEYVTSDETKITVKVAGQTGYVKHSDAYLQPDIAVTKRSYYMADQSRTLKHYIYNPITNQTASYIYGKAPQALAPNVKYYSWDGATFMTEGGKTVGTFHQYFNMLPYRTVTNYSAAELDTVIMKKLQGLESLYRNNPKGYGRYKDATKKSKLAGLGKTVKDFEKYHKINALMVLSTAILESDYGMSANAQNKNNLFGIKVYDSNPGAGASFKTPYDSVAALSSQYLNKNYVPMGGAYANGGILGNKARGVNVRYATDPYWGQKISGYMYTLDKEMGGKDLENNPSPYSIFESIGSLQVYPSPRKPEALYTYPKEGYVFAVTAKEEHSNSAWYRIVSDSNTELNGYVRANYARQLPIAK
ncbi:MAG: S-layer homology domain-containing protein [Bacillus sp. (in: firmicutes)]